MHEEIGNFNREMETIKKRNTRTEKYGTRNNSLNGLIADRT